jgi:hypothetical protein
MDFYGCNSSNFNLGETWIIEQHSLAFDAFTKMTLEIENHLVILPTLKSYIKKFNIQSKMDFAI